MKKVLYLLLLLIPSLGFAQNKSALSFNTKIYDFGTFGEDDNSPSFQFKFINTGKKPIVISHISTSCGCTAAEYTKSPVTLNKEGIIEVTYNPKGRPGKFNKTITAFISGNDEPIKLVIKGNVLSGTKRKYAGYNYVMGGLQLKNNTIYVKKISGLKQISTTILVINGSEETLSIDLSPDSPALTGKANPQILRPGEKGELDITFYTDQNLSGNEKVYVILNSKKDPKNYIQVEKQF